jgi:glycerol-3-phosphate acyltransferase PlsY
MNIIVWIILGFVSGSIPFSWIIGKLIARRDIRTVGDGNPGGANALRAGGLKAGVPAILLDIAKGFAPVYFAQRFGVSGWDLLPVAIAPILGHAFSPFLKFRGGKALAATGGVWLALVGLPALFAYAVLAVPFTLLQEEDALSANAGMVSLLVYAALRGPAWLFAFAALNAALIVWTHRRDLFRLPQWRPWVADIFSRRGA